MRNANAKQLAREHQKEEAKNKELKNLRKKLPKRIILEKLVEQASDLLRHAQDAHDSLLYQRTFTDVGDVKDAAKEIKQTLIKAEKLARKTVARTVAALVS